MKGRHQQTAFAPVLVAGELDQRSHIDDCLDRVGSGRPTQGGGCGQDVTDTFLRADENDVAEPGEVQYERTLLSRAAAEEAPTPADTACISPTDEFNAADVIVQSSGLFFAASDENLRRGLPPLGRIGSSLNFDRARAARHW